MQIAVDKILAEPYNSISCYVRVVERKATNDEDY